MPIEVKERSWLFRPWFYSPKEGEKSTPENIQKQYKGLDPKPSYIKTTSPATSLGLGALIIGAVLALFGINRDSKATTWSGGILAGAAAAISIIGKFYGVELNGDKPKANTPPGPTKTPEQKATEALQTYSNNLKNPGNDICIKVQELVKVYVETKDERIFTALLDTVKGATYNEHARTEAAFRIKEIFNKDKHVKALDDLISFAKDKSQNISVRKRVLATIADIFKNTGENNKVVPTLIDVFNDREEDKENRAWVPDLLVDIYKNKGDTEVIKPIFDSFGHIDDYDLFIVALGAVCEDYEKTKDSFILKNLVRCAANKTDTGYINLDFRSAILENLGYAYFRMKGNKDERVIACLQNFAKDRDHQIQEQAVRSLKIAHGKFVMIGGKIFIQDTITPTLNTSDPPKPDESAASPRVGGIEVIEPGTMDDTEPPTEYISMFIESTDPTITDTAKKALIKIGAPAVQPLIEEVHGIRTYLRTEAGKVIVAIGEPAVSPLIECLQDQRDTVKWFSSKLLGEIGDQAALEPLNKLLETETDEEIRKVVQKSIEQIQARQKSSQPPDAEAPPVT